MKKTKISADKWKWFGKAGHFICGEDCRFHLCTRVGKYLISTVGEYLPDAPVREINAQCRNITLIGMGDERRHDYMKKLGYQDVGYGRKYETMVFKSNGMCQCGCGQPKIVPIELEMKPSNSPKQARDSHMGLCFKYSRL